MEQFCKFLQSWQCSSTSYQFMGGMHWFPLPLRLFCVVANLVLHQPTWLFLLWWWQILSEFSPEYSCFVFGMISAQSYLDHCFYSHFVGGSLNFGHFSRSLLCLFASVWYNHKYSGIYQCLNLSSCEFFLLLACSILHMPNSGANVMLALWLSNHRFSNLFIVCVCFVLVQLRGEIDLVMVILIIWTFFFFTSLCSGSILHSLKYKVCLQFLWPDHRASPQVFAITTFLPLLVQSWEK